jgi:hypothetical protein
MTWIPNTDLLGSGASVAGYKDGIGIPSENKKRTTEVGCLQFVPIELAPFGVEPTLIREFDEA